MSLKICTDELLLDLVSPSRIASVTFLSREKASLKVWPQGARLPVNHGTAEEIPAARPDLILTQTQCAVCAVTPADLEESLCAWTGLAPQLRVMAVNQLAYSPERLIDAIQAAGTKDLTIASNNAGIDGEGLAPVEPWKSMQNTGAW